MVRLIEQAIDMQGSCMCIIIRICTTYRTVLARSRRLSNSYAGSVVWNLLSFEFQINLELQLRLSTGSPTLNSKIVSRKEPFSKSGNQDVGAISG